MTAELVAHHRLSTRRHRKEQPSNCIRINQLELKGRRPFLLRIDSDPHLLEVIRYQRFSQRAPRGFQAAEVMPLYQLREVLRMRVMSTESQIDGLNPEIILWQGLLRPGDGGEAQNAVQKKIDISVSLIAPSANDPP